MKTILKIGNFLFKYRSFTPIPLILIVFIFFKPLINPGNDYILTTIGFIVLIFGEFIRIISVGYSFTGTSGRENFLRADNLNVSGIYSIVRNPLYIGNLLIYTGLLIVYSNLYAFIFFNTLLILQYFFIIRAEESYLEKTYGDEYKKYKNSVYSIAPRFGNYIKPENRFNRLKVIFKENDSVFNALVIFGLIILYKGYILSGRIVYGKSYAMYFGILIIFYILIKLLKKKISHLI